MLLDLTQYDRKYQLFIKKDSKNFPYTYNEFWKWKVKIEAEDASILDREYITETYDRLSQTLKLWQWHRPYTFSKLEERLKDALESIREPYNHIKQYSLLDFPAVPYQPLEEVWHELGRIKETDGKRKRSGYYLVMGITKALMFLWGQTLAFDTDVRKHMPNFNRSDVKHGRWTYGLWRTVMLKLQTSLKKQPKLIEHLNNLSLREYGETKVIPYGQFLDLYYWVDES